MPIEASPCPPFGRAALEHQQKPPSDPLAARSHPGFAGNLLERRVADTDQRYLSVTKRGLQRVDGVLFVLKGQASVRPNRNTNAGPVLTTQHGPDNWLWQEVSRVYCRFDDPIQGRQKGFESVSFTETPAVKTRDSAGPIAVQNADQEQRFLHIDPVSAEDAMQVS